jgi:penicillin-binding protein 1A
MPLWMALARSLNTVASELSFAVGREKVIEMTQRLGITGVRKSCSMALGDYGIIPIEHVGGMATFANDGKSAKPYGILDIVNSKGELVYNREHDEPQPAQLVSQQVARGMNFMLNKVVTEGTAKAADLDFTNVAGKTGTSSGPTDVWFVGFTGKYVAGVWLGNDDNRPMASGNTGGHLAAPIWHSFMAVAHRDMNIATIPGLQPHPVQVAEMQRIAELKLTDPAAAAAEIGETAAGKPAGSLMSQPARDALKRIASAMRKAAGLPEPVLTPAPAGPTPIDGRTPAPTKAVPPGGRADAATPAGRDRPALDSTGTTRASNGGEALSSAIP